MKHYESISEYNDVIYDSRPVKLDDYLSDKYNIVHRELYNDALNKFLYGHVSYYINWEFMYNMFNILNDATDFETEFENEFSNNKSIITKSLNALEIPKKEFLSNFLNIVDDLINELKQILINEDIVAEHQDDIYNIIKLTLGNISDFRVVYYKEDGIYLGTESEDDASFIISEDDNNPFLFLIGYEDKILNIKFDKYGNWFIQLKNGYDYSSLDKFEISEKILENSNKSIIEKIKELTIKLFCKYHKIIEIKNTEYWMESDIIVIHNIKPYSKHNYSLKNYWNYYQKYEDYDISDLKITKENINDSYVDNIDYINGKATMYSKINNINYDVPFKYLNNESKLGENLLLSNTFTSNI